MTYSAAGILVGLVGGFAAQRIVTARGEDIWARRWLSILPVVTAVSTAALWLLLLSTSDLKTPTRHLGLELGVAALLVLSAGADLCGRIIPNEFMALGALAGLGFLYGEASWMAHVLTAGGLIGVGIAIREISHRTLGRTGIGMGDIKLMAVLGLWMGPQALWVSYLSVACAAFVGSALIVFGITDRQGQLPLAPFVLVGYLIQQVALDAQTALALIQL